jgi:hypothetical protein
VKRHVLDLHRHRTEAPQPRVLVDRSRPGLGYRRRRQRRAGDEAEEAPAGAAGQPAVAAPGKLAEHSLDRHSCLRQRLVEASAQLVHVKRGRRAGRRVERAAEASGEVGYGGVEIVHWQDRCSAPRPTSSGEAAPAPPASSGEPALACAPRPPSETR